MSPEKGNYLEPYRRHLSGCSHKSKGQGYSLCACPIWCYGRIKGIPYRHSLQTNDWPAAQRRIEVLLATDCPRLPDGNARSIQTAATAYLAECAHRNLRPGSIRSYTRTLNQLAKFTGPRSITELNIELLSRFRDSRRVAPRTQRKEIEYLRAFCAFCQLHKWIPENPAKLMKPPKVEDGATVPFRRDEVDKLLTACEEMRGMWDSDTPAVRQRARALVLILLYSGLRVGDVAKLRRSQLEKSGHLVLRTEKNNVPVKVLLNDEVARELRALPAPGGNPTYFFWSGNGDPDDCSKSLWRTISRLGEVAGVHAHPHRFRDTFAVELISNGTDLRTVQKLLGHSSIKTTEKHYASFVPAHQRLLDEATAKLDFRQQPKVPILVDRRRKRA